MEDTCNPGKNKVLQSYRIYTIVIPCAVVIFILEAAYVLSNIPGNIGSSMSLKATLPQRP